jgi:hypothetical protein
MLAAEFYPGRIAVLNQAKAETNHARENNHGGQGCLLCLIRGETNSVNQSLER